MEHPYEEGMKVYINDSGHMAKIATMAINNRNLLKIFFSRTRRPVILKLGMNIRAWSSIKIHKSLFSEEYKSDFRKFAQKQPLNVIIFLTVSVLPSIFLTRLVKCL